jgi:hypothetical protein
MRFDAREEKGKMKRKQMIERRMSQRRQGRGRRVIADRRLSLLPPEEQEKFRALLRGGGMPIASRSAAKPEGERRLGRDRRSFASRRAPHDRRAA